MTSEELECAKWAAREAGKRIMEIYSDGNLKTAEKGDGSPVTLADREANNIIIDDLRENFSYAAISEEGDSSRAAEGGRVWIIDPLDGTKEFISGSGEFTVNIALVENGSPILGVVYAPAKGELYYASDEGAFLEKNNRNMPLRVSGKSTISEMTLAVSRSHSGMGEEGIKRFFGKTIAAGSSIKGCLIAKGEADAYFRFGPVHGWDICAMDCILREAGGRLSDLSGNPIAYGNNELIHGFLASNDKIHEGLLSLQGRKDGQTGRTGEPKRVHHTRGI